MKKKLFLGVCGINKKINNIKIIKKSRVREKKITAKNSK